MADLSVDRPEKWGATAEKRRTFTPAHEGERACVTDSGKVKYTIVKMCAWMEVLTSGFHEWLSPSATARRRGHLSLLIGKALTDSDGTYEYRRVRAQLAR